MPDQRVPVLFFPKAGAKRKKARSGDRAFRVDERLRPLDVQGVPERGQTGFLQAFALGGMGVDDRAEIVGARAHLDGDGKGGQEFGDAAANGLEPDDQAFGFSRYHAHEPVLGNLYHFSDETDKLGFDSEELEWEDNFRGKLWKVNFAWSKSSLHSYY